MPARTASRAAPPRRRTARRRVRVGLISDTHGLLRPEAVAALRGSDLIVHAGDVGDRAILAALGRLAPVRAVRGNNDRGPWAAALPATDRIDIGGIALHVIHDVAELSPDALAAGCRVVVAGHSHRPGHHVRDGVHFVNPGSAGPRRFRLPVSVARLSVTGARVEVELVELAVAPPGIAPLRRPSAARGKRSARRRSAILRV